MNSASPAEVRAARVTTAGRGLLLAALLVMVLSRGAVSPTALLCSLLLAGSGLLLGLWSRPVRPEVVASFRLALILAAGLSLYLLFQSWSVPGHPLGNPLWRLAERYVGAVPSAISVDPAVTRTAIFPLVSPFLFYAAGLALFSRDDGALRLLRWLAAFGAGFAVFGIAQVAFFRDSLFLVEKTAYLDSLTGSFVNRNTAGTLLGVTGLLLLTLLALQVRSGDGERFALGRMLLGAVRLDRANRAASALLLLLLVVLLALFLTKSRGAMASTAVAVVFAMSLLSALSASGSGTAKGAGGRARLEGARIRRVAIGFVVSALVVLMVVGLFGGLTIQRMEARGVDDLRLCIYRSTLDAIGQNWLFGTGFGTFASVFPIYRSAACGAASDVVLRAHNVYLEGLLGLGIVFIPFLLLIYGHLVRNLVYGLRHRRRLRCVPAIALAAVILVTLHGLVDFSLQMPAMAAFCALYLAASTTISLSRRGLEPMEARAKRDGAG